MRIGQQNFILGERTFLMGILNVTPDSFSDGGQFNTLEAAVKQAKKLVEEGADLLDIGGESTRPGHAVISVEEEIRRTAPLIEILSKEIKIPISIDTSKAAVAEAAIKAGAGMVNDVWGLKGDLNLAGVIAKYKVPCCLMHNRKAAIYDNLMDDLLNDLQESIKIARRAGISDENIVLDPGIGFAKTLDHNLAVMKRLEELSRLGYPVLLGTSRKSMIGLTLDLPVTERLEGTLATTVIGIMKGCDFIRVHDVKENKRVAMMTDAIVRNKEYSDG
ncbi:MAG: dihydropteroate synthase [Vallitaleaceae bacterium]|nr:dihydropteroate synthase [Vallitaleaceae bacterium]